MAGNLPFGLAPSGELTAYQPTLRERVTDWLRQSLFTDDRAGQDKANYLTNWGETMIPPFGFATSMYDAGNQAGRGNYLGAGLTAGAAFIPGPEGKAAEKAGIRAFHGSPHSFDKFEWSPRTYGTGEGAQAYGHGLYFAENEGIAKSYRDALSRQTYYDGASTSNFHPSDSNTSAAISAVAQRVADGEDPASAIAAEAAKWRAAAAPFAKAATEKPELASIALQRAKSFEDVATATEALDPAKFVKNPGHVYEVNINADPNSFLDWDKPLSEQQAFLEKLGKSKSKYARELLAHPDLLSPNRNVYGTDIGPMTGQDAFKHLALATTGKVTGGPKTTELLNKAGIPGIKYLDAGSRGAGDGTRNYVVFDDKLISIVRKYGIAGASAYLGYDIMQNVTPAQAEELKKIEGK